MIVYIALKKALRLMVGKNYDYFVENIERFMHRLFLDPSFGIWIPLNDKEGLVKVMGLSLVVPEDNSFIVREVYRDKVYLLPKLGDIVVDVGAHYGIYTILSATIVSSKGLVLAFEPYPHSYRTLLLNATLNRLSNVKAFNVALGDFDGTAKLYIASSPAYHSTMFEVGEKALNVYIRRLDNVIEELALDRIDLIKIDAEGAELKILKGAQNVIKRFKPKLTVATYHYSNEAHEITRWLRSFSYKVFPTKTHLHAETPDCNTSTAFGNHKRKVSVWEKAY